MSDPGNVLNTESFLIHMHAFKRFKFTVEFIIFIIIRIVEYFA